jgi:Short C-terminal domain
MRRLLLGVGVLLLSALELMADGKAQGYVVTSSTASVYARADGDKIIYTLQRGDGLVALRTGVLGEKLSQSQSNGWVEQKKNGRLHVEFPASRPQTRQLWETEGWINVQDVSGFQYECGCGPSDNSCAPFIYSGLGGARWNPCFTNALEGKQAALGTTSATQVVPFSPAATTIADTSGMPCVGTFSQTNVSKGFLFQMETILAEVEPAAAVQLVTDNLKSKHYSVLSSDPASGTIQALGKSSGRPYTIKVVVTDGQPGSRVTTTLKLPENISPDRDALRNELCAAVQIGKGRGREQPQSTPSRANVEERLRALDDLYKKGLISAEEYKQKRAAILAEL